MIIPITNYTPRITSNRNNKLQNNRLQSSQIQNNPVQLGKSKANTSFGAVIPLIGDIYQWDRYTNVALREGFNLVDITGRTDSTGRSITPTAKKFNITFEDCYDGVKRLLVLLTNGSKLRYDEQGVAILTHPLRKFPEYKYYDDAKDFLEELSKEP